MNKNKSSKEQSSLPPTNYKFYLGSRERYIHIDCSFESGNIQLVRQLSQFNYRLSCIDDGVKTNHRVNSKSWFYFSVHGFPKNTKGKFAVSRVQTLMSVYAQHPKSYRPVFRQCTIKQGFPDPQWSKWARIPTQSPLILRETGQLECTFQFPFKNQTHKVEFAFTYPYSYSKNINYLNSLNQYYCHDQFYFHKQILAKSAQQRDIHLLTITSYDQQNKQIEEEQLFDDKLFPQKCRPKRFKKPVVLITARVHPGETAASYTMEGIINFLTNNKDLRSYLLKKMFVFMIVPMINPDGVYHGHFRMDSYGKNLNRYYSDPSFEKQPTIYAIKELANHLIKDNRLSFYFDLHAHNAKKGAFIYGNAINDFVEQVESQVFCKLFALNNSGFQYEYCNFSIKQMNSKDRNEDRTKQGCGRVVMHRIANIIHSYSLECGIISSTKSNIISPSPNSQFSLAGKGITCDKEEKSTQPIYFTQESYRQLGRSLLISILDVFDKNPYNKVYNSIHKSMEFLRRVTAFEVFHTAERFRMFEKYVFGKVRNINQLIKQVLNSKLHYRQLYNFYFYNDEELKNCQWPQNIPGLVKPKYHHKLKKFKSLQEPKLQYSIAFIKDLQANRNQLDEQESNPIQYPPEYLPEQNAVEYSSQTEDSMDERELDENYYNEIMESYRITSKSQVINIGQTQTNPESKDIEKIEDELDGPWLASQRNCYSEKDTQSVYDKHTDLTESKFNELKEVKKIRQLKIFEKAQEFQNDSKISSQSPSVRVRRLLKNQNGAKKVKMSNEQMKEKLNELISNPTNLVQSGAFHSGSTFSKANGIIAHNSLSSVKSNKQQNQSPSHQDRQMKLFEQIKMEIKEELRRHKERNEIVCSTIKTPIKIKSNFSAVKDKERIKSTNVNFLNLNLNAHSLSNKHRSQNLNRVPSRSNITKTQLPALNSHILIITSNSSKGLVLS